MSIYFLILLSIFFFFQESIAQAQARYRTLHWWVGPPYIVFEQDVSKTHLRKKRETLFKRFGNRNPACPEGNQALCDTDFLNLKLNQKMTNDLTGRAASSSTLCVGLCDKQAGVQWKFRWR